MQDDDTKTPTPPEEPDATEQPDTESPSEPAAGALMQPSPLVLTIGFIIIALLGVVIFQNLIPKGNGSNREDSPAVEALRADLETRRAEINRERLSLGYEPLSGTTGLETAEEVADRLKTDADTLASLASSFQDLLARKETQLDDLRAESIAALKEQRRLRDMVTAANQDLRTAMIDASLANTLKGDVDRANARVAALQEELALAREEPDQLRDRLIKCNSEKNALLARVAELEEQMRKVDLFAKSENELMKEAVALYQALRRLQGATKSELASAYSRFGAELGAEVLTVCDFATGSAEVRLDLENRLRAIPAEVPDSAMIFVVGYASETGNVDDNQTLSSNRATAVARVLDTIKRPGQRVQAVYLGQTKRFSKDTPEENQRVEIWQIMPRSR